MDPSLEKETKEFWTAIIKYSYNIKMIFSCKFNTDMMVVDTLKDIEKKDLIDFYKTFFQISSASCRRLMVVYQNSERVYGNGDGGDDSIEDYDDLYATVKDLKKKCKWW